MEKEAHPAPESIRRSAMASKNPDRAPSVFRRVATLIAATGGLAMAAGEAHAVGVPGADLYMGVGLGRSDADIDVIGDFNPKDTGWKIFVGGRVISYFGAEIDYVDFGKPDGDDASLKYKALAGYGLFYLPLPLPVVDFYVKAGVARMDSDLRVTANSFNTKDTTFAYGGGVQVKLGSFALRGEYEKYKVDDAKPSMMTVAFSKSFL
jgi:hypothetical protein